MGHIDIGFRGYSDQRNTAKIGSKWRFGLGYKDRRKESEELLEFE